MNLSNIIPKTRLNRYAFWVFFAVAAIFLWSEHKVHVIEYLPLSLLLLCVGMHFFMHGSHGHGASSNVSGNKNEQETHIAALSHDSDKNDSENASS